MEIYGMKREFKNKKSRMLKTVYVFQTTPRVPPFPGLKNAHFSTRFSKELHCSAQTDFSDFDAPERVPPFLGMKNAHFSTRFSKELHCSEQTGFLISMP